MIFPKRIYDESYPVFECIVDHFRNHCVVSFSTVVSLRGRDFYAQNSDSPAVCVV